MSGDGERRFSPAMRLKLRRDFREVYRRGIVWKGSSFSLHVLPQSEGTRLGIVIPRRWGKAVERNRMKRVLREAFRRCASELPSADIIVRPASSSRTASGEALEEELVDAVNEIVRKEVSR